MTDSKNSQPGKSKVEALAELERQRHDLTARIEAERAEAVAEIVSMARNQAEEIGVTVDELVRAFGKGGKHHAAKVAGSRSPAAAKYRNPKNPSEVWSGRGRKPLWVVGAMTAGATLESLVIDTPA